jgi:multiple sugar transport system permease protein
LWPIYSLLRVSLESPAELGAMPMHFVPLIPMFSSYLRMVGFSTTVFGQMVGPIGIWHYYLEGLVNSAIVASATTVLALFFSFLAGYAFARYRFRLKGTLLGLLLFSRTLPPIVMLIPYLAFFGMVHLTGTLVGLTLTYLVLTVPFVTWVLIGFFGSLPKDVENAARVDGCTRVSVLRKIILPISAPGVASVGIIAWLMAWNEFIFALLLVGGTPATTVPPVLEAIFVGGSFPALDLFSVYSSGVMISIIPAIIVSCVFQRYITRLKIVDPGAGTLGQ